LPTGNLQFDLWIAIERLGNRAQAEADGLLRHVGATVRPSRPDHPPRKILHFLQLWAELQ
jgi:hypothetical protein